MIRIPRPVWGIIAVYITLASIYATVTPLFEKPDEQWHFAFAMYLANHNLQLPDLNDPPPDYFAEQQGTQAPAFYLAYAALLRLLDFDLDDDAYLRLARDNPQELPGSILWPDNLNKFIGTHCTTAGCTAIQHALYTGRVLNIAFGALSLLAAAWAITLTFPNRPFLAIAVTAAIALLPQFLHISSSTTNDILAITATNFALAFFALWYRHPTSMTRAALIGVAAGLAALSKASAASIGLVMGLALLFAAPLSPRQRIRPLIAYGIAAVLICGWWYLHNLLQYGDPTALNIHLTFRPVIVPEFTASRILVEWIGVIDSFWGNFGWGNITLSGEGYVLLKLLFFILTASGLWAIFRQWRQFDRGERVFFAICLLQTLLVGALLFRWMRQTEAALGRLMFPALVPIALLVVFGLLYGLSRRESRFVVTGLVAFSGAFALILPVSMIIPAYQPAPAIWPVTDENIQQPLLAFNENDGEPEAVIEEVRWKIEDRWVLLQLDWRVSAPFMDDYVSFIHLVDANGSITSQRDTHPGLGNRPTTTWEAGDVFGDVYAIPYDGRAFESIRVGLYRTIPGGWERVPVTGDTGIVEDNAVLLPASPFAAE